MVISLQEQLKKSGLVDDKKAKQLRRAKFKEEKLTRQGGVNKGKKKNKNSQADERKRELDRIKSEQIAKDRQLNQEKNARAQRNAINAQIRQLIEVNAIAQGGAGQAGEKKYSFADANKIKHLWISQQQVDQLSQGSIVIVRQSEKYALVPAMVADKIVQRNPEAIVFRAEKSTSSTADDPYADYQIPDDLDW
jgi:uncharacterized protein YaiL (DUF2058 family)